MAEAARRSTTSTRTRCCFPNFDDGLREAFRREMELFVESILREDRSVLDLLTADHTFVNERLALHYGIPDVRGARFRRVTLTDAEPLGSARQGRRADGHVVCQSHGAGDSRRVDSREHSRHAAGRAAARRGGVSRRTRTARRRRSVREIMEQHRAKPSCNACHGVMDPLGFALENFDADRRMAVARSLGRHGHRRVGPARRRHRRSAGPVDLRKALLRRPEQFVQTMTEKLMTYALGRSVEYHDMPAVRQIVRDAARDNYRFSSIVMGIVKSAPFQMRERWTEAAPRPYG